MRGIHWLVHGYKSLQQLNLEIFANFCRMLMLVPSKYF